MNLAMGKSRPKIGSQITENTQSTRDAEDLAAPIRVNNTGDAKGTDRETGATGIEIDGTVTGIIETSTAVGRIETGGTRGIETIGGGQWSMKQRVRGLSDIGSKTML